MQFLLTLHGEVRWLLALVGLVATVRFAYGWLGRAEHKGMDRGLMAAFTGLLDLNLLLGLILLFGLGGGMISYRMEHALTMIVAVVLAHTAAIWRRNEDAGIKFRNNLIVVVLVMALALAGVVRLRGSWMF